MKKTYIFIIIALFPFIAAGCIRVKKNTPIQSGIFKSVDRGNNWGQKGLLVVTGGVAPMGSVSVTEMYFDPHDNNALYVAALLKGVFYTYNGGENWHQPPQLSSGNVRALVVDSKNKCIIYAAIANRILKTSDCNRTFQEIFIDGRKIDITSLAVSLEDSLVVFAGTSMGEIIRSKDGGRSWNTIYNHRKKIVKMLLDPHRADTMYVVLDSGLFRSSDGGLSWENLNDGLKKYSGGIRISQMIFNPSKVGSFLIVNNYGIMKTEDGAETWEPYNLITPPLTAKISSLAVNPKSDQQIYYTTASTFYKTEDGGKNWIVRRLPSAAQPNSLLVDPINPSIIYMGTVLPAK